VSRTLSQFVEEREAGWSELSGLVVHARGRVQRLDPGQVRRLGSLYRQVVADLAYARRRFGADPVTQRLEVLARDARPLVYGSLGERESVLGFVTTGFWRRVAERPRMLLISALLLLGPTVAIGMWSHGDPARAAEVAQISELSAGIGQGGGETRDPDTDTITEVGTNAGFSAAIFTNNVRVALAAFAGGLTGGVLTAISLVFNGLVLGLVGGLATHAGNGEALWRLVAPHGVLELSLIVVAGAAGLRTGWALLRPGHRTRGEALATEGRAGLEMALGAAVLLVPCGLVEGFVTPRGLSLASALAVGFGLGAAFWALVLWRGRRRGPDPR
jgi:uncharacterized membrane protein SpoIIM required for sporulation